MKILVVVDMQVDFVTGALGNDYAAAIVPNIVDKLKNIDKSNTLVLFTKDTHYDNYFDTLEGKMLPVKHCIENTPGWGIVKEVSRVVDRGEGYMHYSSGNIINSRIYKNTFGSDTLRDFLIERCDCIEEIEFCGVCTDICVVSNALMARQALPNTRIVVDANCCASITPYKHKAALEVMKSCQIEVMNY